MAIETAYSDQELPGEDWQQTETTCPYCGVGCGVTAVSAENEVMPVSGTANHPANLGRLCVKGSALQETLSAEGRLLSPSIKTGDGFKNISWERSLDLISDKLQQVLNTHGPEAVAFYGAGQLLTEDYYVANKLMKGFIGSANIDTNSRLCMASAVASYKRSLGSDTVPACYEDLEIADLIVITGSNAAWAHPVLFQRISAAKQQRPHMKIVVVDPRKTATCDIADLHLALRPGSDGFLFSALLAYLADNHQLDEDFIALHTQNFEATLAQAKQSTGSLQQTADVLDVSVEDLQTFFRWFAATEKSLTLYSQGINQSATGTDKGNAIINVHLATGRIGKPGASPFSITGQPNAMGGREVGGLSNQLAAHMDFSAADRDRVKRFWNAPNLVSEPGLKAVDMFRAVGEGKIKFLWIMSTNPLVSMPDADAVKEAMRQCDMVVVSDCMANTDTALAAHLLLPAASWGEKNGTVTNSERRISRQRGFLTPPGEAKADWWMICQVARRLGFANDFNYSHPAEIFDEHARLSAFENNGSRDFDLSGLTGLSRAEYDALKPVQWPINDTFPNGRQRFFDDGFFFTDNRKARFVPATPVLPENDHDGDLIMNTGRVRDHWHTMTRTGKSPRLAQHIAEPYAEFHPQDAAQRGIIDGQLTDVFNKRGSILVRAKVTENQRRGEIFVPMHWTSRYAGKARMGTLISDRRDPLSGQPELKFSSVNARPYSTDWRGFILTREDIGEPDHCDYWASGVIDQGFYYEIAGQGDVRTTVDHLESTMSGGNWLRLSDEQVRHHRRILIVDGRIEAVIFTHQQEAFSSRQWLIERFRDDVISNSDRRALLAGKPGNAEDTGAIICSCFQVGEKQIIKAIHAGCNSAAELGDTLKCGTNCGSCIPEIKTLITAQSETISGEVSQ